MFFYHRRFSLWMAAITLGLSGLSMPGHAQFPDNEGYTRLFNGNNLDGWIMQWPGIWTVEGGILTGKQDPATGGDSWLFTESEFDHFALILEFQMTPNCNSGVGICMPKGQEGRPSQYGFEIQISDIDEQYPTGSIFRHVKANQNLHNAKGWNLLHIRRVQDHIVVYLNRQRVVDARLDGTHRGRIGLQIHGGEALKDQVVQFRNIRVKDLAPQFVGTESPIQFKKHKLATGLYEGCSVADINRDGKLDITCGPFWYEAPNWNAHELRHVELQGEYASNYGEYAMDVNRDGWPDVVSGGWFSPILAWYENPGLRQTGEQWKQHIIGDDLQSTEAILLRDIDRDGREDILINRYDATAAPAYFAYVGFDKSETGFEKRIIGIEGRGHGMGVGDINGDGRDDIVTPNGWYECPIDPVREAWVWHGGGGFHADHSSVPLLVDDFNLDGYSDAVYGHAHDFGLYWLEQTRDSAGRVAWIQHTIDDTYSQIHCPILVDLDRDGTNDLIAGKRYRGHNGADPGAMEPNCIYWYKIKKGPDPTFTRYIVSYDEDIGMGMTTRVVDIDYDGDIDIVAAGKTGLYLLENATR